MAILSDKDIFDFDGWQARVGATTKAIEGDVASFVQSLTSWLNRADAAIESNLKGLADYRASLKDITVTTDGADKKISEHINLIAQSGKELQAARQNQQNLTEAQRLNAQIVNELTGKLASLYQKLGSLDDKSKDYAKQQKAVTSEIKTVTRAIDAQSKSLQDGKRALDLADGSYNKLSKETTTLRATLKAMPGAFDANTNAINKNNIAAMEMLALIKANDIALKKMDADMGIHTRNVGNYSDAFKNLATGGIQGAVSGMGIWGIAAVAAGGAAISMGKEILDVTAKFEKYRTILDQSLGSTEAGGAAFKLIQDFAAKTNFSVDELTDAYIKLASRGLRPGEESLKRIADVANATGKPFGQLVEAINDVNSTERWNEIGIKAQTAGNKVSLTFNGVTKVVDRTEAGVLGAVEAFGKLPNVMGMTEKISQTLDGQMSNLGDNFNRLKVTVGGELKEGFSIIISLLSTLIDVAIATWNGLLPIRDALGLVAGAIVDAGKEVWGLIKTIFALDERLGGSFGMLKAFGAVVVFAFKLVASGAIAAVAGIQLAVGGLNILLNKAKEVANFFGAKFKIDAQATFENLTKAAEKAANRLESIWKQGVPTTAAAPGKIPDAVPGKPLPKSESDLKKEEQEREKARQQEIAYQKALRDERLAVLNQQHEDGLISEKAYLLQKLELTKEGIDEELKLVKGTGKEALTERVKLNRQRIDAEREYKREVLKLNLESSKTDASKAIAGLSRDKEDGTISDSDFNERRRGIMVASLNEQKQMLIDAGQANSKLVKEIDADLLDVDRVYYKERANIADRAWKQQMEDTKAEIGKIDSQSKENLADRLRTIQKAHDDEETVIQMAVARHEITEVEGERRITKAKLDQIAKATQATQAAYDTVEALTHASVEKRIAALQKFTIAARYTESEVLNAQKEINKLKEEEAKRLAENEKNRAKEVGEFEVNANKTANDQKLKDTKEAEEKKNALIQGSFQLANALADSFFSISADQRQRESDQLDREHENELLLAGDNADAKQQIELNYSKKKAEIARKAAIAEREQALFSIAINTAQAVMSVLSTGGGAHYLDFGVSAGILSAFVTAAGIAQAAAVLAKPLPVAAYKTGKRATDSYEGRALAGEAGAELFVDREGNAQLFDKPTLFNTKRGDTVYTASETAAILSGMGKESAVAQVLHGISQTSQTAKSLHQGRLHEQVIIHQLASSGQPALSESQLKRAFGDALDSRPVNETHIDWESIKRGQRQKNSYTEYVDKRTRL